MDITAFKMGLHPDSALPSSLTRRPPKTVWGLMKKVEEYCKVEDDALRVKAGRKANKTAPPEIAQPISSVPPQSPEPRQPIRDGILADQAINAHTEQTSNYKLIVGAQSVPTRNTRSCQSQSARLCPKSNIFRSSNGWPKWWDLLTQEGRTGGVNITKIMMMIWTVAML